MFKEKELRIAPLTTFNRFLRDTYYEDTDGLSLRHSPARLVSVRDLESGSTDYVLNMGKRLGGYALSDMVNLAAPSPFDGIGGAFVDQYARERAILDDWRNFLTPVLIDLHSRLLGKDWDDYYLNYGKLFPQALEEGMDPRRNFYLFEHVLVSYGEAEKLFFASVMYLT